MQNRTGIMDLQNKSNILVAKQWKIRNPVPMSYIICKKEDEVDKVTEKGQKMIPQGPKSAPKSIENTASNPTRKIMRKTDLPAAIRRPPHPALTSVATLPPHTPRGGEDNALCRCLSQNSSNVCLNH